MFGHVITFNFAKRGETHGTFVGGCFSLIVKLGLLAYIVVCFKRMFNHESDTMITVVGSLDLQEEGDVDYTSLGMTPHWVLRKQDNSALPMVDQKDLNTYIDFYFLQQTANWYKPVNQGRFTYERVEAR